MHVKKRKKKKRKVLPALKTKATGLRTSSFVPEKYSTPVYKIIIVPHSLNALIASSHIHTRLLHYIFI